MVTALRSSAQQRHSCASTRQSPHLLKNPAETLGISAGIIDRIVSVPGDTLLLPARGVERIIPAAGVQITNSSGAEADRICSCELVTVPVPELPIEGGIVRPEYRTPSLRYPVQPSCPCARSTTQHSARGFLETIALNLSVRRAAEGVFALRSRSAAKGTQCDQVFRRT
jgi:hypothetical protein